MGFGSDNSRYIDSLDSLYSNRCQWHPASRGKGKTVTVLIFDVKTLNSAYSNTYNSWAGILWSENDDRWTKPARHKPAVDPEVFGRFSLKPHFLFWSSVARMLEARSTSPTHTRKSWVECRIKLLTHRVMSRDVACEKAKVDMAYKIQICHRKSSLVTENCSNEFLQPP